MCRDGNRLGLESRISLSCSPKSPSESLGILVLKGRGGVWGLLCVYQFYTASLWEGSLALVG